jgi:flagellar biosynthesis/type III secretory pathway M-ring protein FliF/YscJ
MDFVKAQLDRIQQQLGGLSATQKMLTASLVAIMVMTLIWWARYAGQAEMVALLDQALDDAQVAQITARLSGRGISYSLGADRRVLVSADRRDEALADLWYNELLPNNVADAFDAMVRQMNPFDTAEKTGFMFNHAKELELGQIIARFPGVRAATVKIDPRSERRIGNSIAPSATIAIQLDRGATTPNHGRLARAAAGVVAGAQADLKRSKISVTIDGDPIRVPDEDQGYAASDLLEHDSLVEKYYRTKIEDALRPIPGIIVGVEVEISSESMQRQQKKYDPTGAVQKPVEEESRNTESTRAEEANGEPGAVANAGMVSVEPGASAGGDSKTEDFTRTKYEARFSETVESTNVPAGKEKLIGVAVSVPRSHLVKIYKQGQPTSQDPDDAALAGVTQQVLASVRRTVSGTTGLAEGKVIAEVYPDFPVEVADLADVAPTRSIATSVGAYGREIGIGALALVSLLMVSAMVRRGAAPPVPGANGESRTPPRLAAGEAIAGVVGDGDGMLDGMELDEDAIKAQQMLQQVQTMVKDNPDAAANLVKRWLNRT